MAKFRFPGKALKLNYRKRVKFRFGDETNPEEQRVIQIKSGLILFNQLFGESDEDEEFDGFGSHSLSKTVNKPKKVKKVNVSITKSAENVKCGLEVNCYDKSQEKNCREDGGSSPTALVNGLNDEVSAQEAVILEQKKDSKVECEEKNDSQLSNVSIEKLKNSKRVKETTERTSKKFVLPMVSARSSRIIKPNKRLFSDFTSLCSTNQQIEESKFDPAEKIPETGVVEASQKVVIKVKHVDPEGDNFNHNEEESDDPVCRSITFYTDSITEEFKGQVGRPPKRPLRRSETQPKEEFTGSSSVSSNSSPSKDPKEDKVKEKIEKLLRSPWDDRIKQNSKVSGKKEDKTSISLPFGNATISKSILRKARLNLNKQTLQKIRSPASVQRLVPLSEEETADNKCGLCQSSSCNTICRYGVSCCETCHLSINYFTEGLSFNLECLGGQGECQLVGLSIEERCMACWLSRILLTCAMPSLLHDRLRKYLPSPLREKVPTSLGRSFNVNAVMPEDVAGEGMKVFSGDCGAGGFGSLVDLPGGWKRKNGSEVVVISPSGEKFRSITKLEEYLKRQGINAQASVLFGNLNSKSIPNSDAKLGLKQPSKSLNKVNNVVVTTLPGGWTRRIKWRNTGDRFDTYVCSPDGRTFRSSRELSAYFQHIGKVDDIHKYFPVRNSTTSCANSSENSEASSTEPVSSSEACSEGSMDEKSPRESDSEAGENVPESNEDEIQKSFEASKYPDEYLEESSSKPLDNRSVGYNSIGSPKESNEEAKTSETVIISNLNSQLHSSNGILPESSNETPMLSPQDEGITSIELPSLSEKEEVSMTTLSDSESREDVRGVNLNMFNKKNHKHHKKSKKRDSCELDKKEENLKADKIVLKINKKSLKPPLVDGVKESSAAVKHKKKRKKKKKRKHERHSEEVDHRKEKSLQKESNYPLVCDVDKISTNVTEQNGDLQSDSDGRLSLVSENPNNINPAFFDDVNLSSIPCHPNDTWQTLISQSIPNAVNESKTKDISQNETVLETPLEKLLNNEFKEPPAELQQSPPECNPGIKKAKKTQKLSGFTTQHFGNGWGRKIKWNEKGQGKVSFLTSPDGQKIVSSIELLAYFKKAGKTMLNMDYYFPKNLVRELPKEEEPPVNEPSNEEALQRLSPTPTVKEKIEERKKERKVLYRPPKSKFGKKAFKLLQTPVNRVKVKSKSPNGGTESNVSCNEEVVLSPNDAETHHGSEAGPRVKHVCRSQAQVLGMPRAVFPSPGNDKPPLKKKAVYPGKKSKFLSVTTPKGKRVLKKTLWCNKCPGCTTPNCKVCVNCLDMKKYGGPGTKKKPCIMRKCYNPLRAIKDMSETTTNYVETTTVATAAVDECDEKKNQDRLQAVENSSVQVVNTSTPVNSLDRESDLDLMSDFAADSVEERKNDDPDEEVVNSAEKSIFVPKMMKPSIEAKDKGDIQAGKECIPGTRVNIDYWQAYDAEEMLTSGFPVITSVPLQIDSFCFRCGSAGMEQLLYCIWCCEGVHPFCLEEGEGPDNDEEEALWVCRKCTVCHVCGGSGHYDLLQCSGCKRHYHMECLGPSSHVSCQPSQEGIWVTETLRLLSLSWPKQTPIIDVSEFSVSDSPEERVVLLEELENLQPFHELPDNDGKVREWETCLLPSAMTHPEWQLPDLVLCSPDKEREEELVESVQIEDTFADLEEEEHICLEDAFEGLEEIPSPSPPKEEEIVHFFRDAGLSTVSASKLEEREFARMEDDEYLALKYKKILPFRDYPIETSLLRILHIINSELFDFLDYAISAHSCDEGMNSENNFTQSTPDPKAEVIQRESTKSPIDLDSVVQIRRAEVQQVMRDLEEIRIQEEKRFKEIEREKSRKRRMESSKEGSEKENLKGRKKLKHKRNTQQPSPNFTKEAIVDQIFVEYEDRLFITENPSGIHWQPQSWEEFDALFSNIATPTTHSHASSNGKKKRKEKNYVFGTLNREIVKRKRGRPCEKDSLGQRRAKRLKMAQCSVKVTRLELRKWKTGRKSLSPRKRKQSPAKSLLQKSPLKQSPPKKICIEASSSSSADVVVIESQEGNKNIEKGDAVNADPKIEIILSHSLDEMVETVIHEFPSGTLKEIKPTDESRQLLKEEQDEEESGQLNHKEEEVEEGSSHSNYIELSKFHEVEKDSYGTVKEERLGTRPRRTSYGRASELASLRKAMLDN